MSTQQHFETDVPLRILNRDDRLLWNLTLGQISQWAICLGVAVLIAVLIPDAAGGARITIGTFILAAGWFFIHRPLGGLVGGQWIMLMVRYRREHVFHQALPPDHIVRMPHSHFTVVVSVPEPAADSGSDLADLPTFFAQGDDV